MDVYTLPFQVKNRMSRFPLRCILVAFFHERKFLFAVYVNVNTGNISCDFNDSADSMLLVGESRYPYLTADECQKQEEICQNLFKPATYETTFEQMHSRHENVARTLNVKKSSNTMSTNEVEVSIGDL